MPLYEALKMFVKDMEYNRFKIAIISFTEEYKIYNFNVNKASANLLTKFNYEEVHTLINILDKNNADINAISLLESFKYTISVKINNNIKIYYLKENYSIIFLSILLLIISFVIIIYPISVQIMNNLNIMLT